MFRGVDSKLLILRALQWTTSIWISIGNGSMLSSANHLFQLKPSFKILYTYQSAYVWLSENFKRLNLMSHVRLFIKNELRCCAMNCPDIVDLVHEISRVLHQGVTHELKCCAMNFLDIVDFLHEINGVLHQGVTHALKSMYWRYLWYFVRLF